MAIFELGWPSQKKTGTAQEPPNAAWPQVISSPSSLSAANAPLEPVTNHHLGILNSVTSNWEEFSQNKKWYPLIAFPNSVNPFFRGKPTERKTQQLRCKRPLICPERHLVSAQRNGVGIVLADCLLLMPSQAMQVKRPSHHSQVAHQLVPWDGKPVYNFTFKQSLMLNFSNFNFTITWDFKSIQSSTALLPHVTTLPSSRIAAKACDEAAISRTPWSWSCTKPQRSIAGAVSTHTEGARRGHE